MAYERVAAWNAARYDRVFNMPLLVSLLEEEHKETVDATAAVDTVDGLCDQTFVAFGGLWKLNIEEDLIAQAMGEAILFYQEVVEQGTIYDFTSSNKATAANIKALVSELRPQDLFTTAKILAMIVVISTQAIANEFKLNPLAAFEIVCDSNDSKAIKRTAPDVKANIDKGSSFVPPEARLQALLDEVTANVKH